MNFSYFCSRDKDQLTPVIDSRMPLKRRNSFILMAGVRPDSKVSGSVLRGGAVLFFTLLVLIFNHSLFGQNEKPFNPAGGNSKYNCQNVTTSKNPALLASNGCWRLGVVATEKPSQKWRIHKNWSQPDIVFESGRARIRNWLNARRIRQVLSLQHKGIPIFKK